MVDRMVCNLALTVFSTYIQFALAHIGYFLYIAYSFEEILVLCRVRCRIRGRRRILGSGFGIMGQYRESLRFGLLTIWREEKEAVYLLLDFESEDGRGWLW